MQTQGFFQMLQYLLAANSIDIIASDLSESKLVGVFTGRVQMVNKPTHISGFLINLVYIRKL